MFVVLSSICCPCLVFADMPSMFGAALMGYIVKLGEGVSLQWKRQSCMIQTHDADFSRENSTEPTAVDSAASQAQFTVKQPHGCMSTMVTTLCLLKL